MKKKKFKETNFGKIITGIGGGVLNTLTGGVTGALLDFDGDGKVTTKDLKAMTWQQWLAMGSSVGVLAYLTSKGVIDVDKLIDVVQAILPLIG